MRSRIGLVLVMAAAVGGCGILDPGGGQRGEAEDNRELWESTKPMDYAYVLARLCFCGPTARGPVRVLVQDGQPAGRTYTDTGLAVSSELAPFFPTIDGLYEVILEALDKDAHEVRVTYDEATGIPVDIWIDYEEFTADEEVGFSVTLPIEEDPATS